MPIPGPKKAIRLAAKSLKDGIQSAKKIGEHERTSLRQVK